MYKETLTLIYEGEDIMFTFKSEAESFAIQHKLEIVYDDGGMIDEEHYNVKGFKSKLYWIAR